MRCGRPSALDPGSDAGDPDRQDVCLVDVAFTNESDQARSFSDTGDRLGPTWRVVGYDTRAHEFHGHARPAAGTLPYGSGTTELVFDVPTGLRLDRVLLDDAMVALTG